MRTIEAPRAGAATPTPAKPAKKNPVKREVSQGESVSGLLPRYLRYPSSATERACGRAIFAASKAMISSVPVGLPSRDR